MWNTNVSDFPFVYESITYDLFFPPYKSKANYSLLEPSNWLNNAVAQDCNAGDTFKFAALMLALAKCRCRAEYGLVEHRNTEMLVA